MMQVFLLFAEAAIVGLVFGTYVAPVAGNFVAIVLGVVTAIIIAMMIIEWLAEKEPR